MLAKLYALRNEREEGFTLIELLVVILIIGILAAIAIPAFLNQRKSAVDSTVESDVRNAANAVEDWASKQYGSGVGISQATLVEKHGLKVSEGVTLQISGTNSGGYCILGFHEGADRFVSASSAATYDSLAGGLNKDGTACAGGASNESGDNTGPATSNAQITNGTDNDDVELSAAWVGSYTEFTVSGSNMDGGIQGNISFFCDGSPIGYQDSFYATLSGGTGSGSPMDTPTDCAGVLTAVVTAPEGASSYDPLYFTGSSTVTVSGSPAAAPVAPTTSIAGSGTLTGSVWAQVEGTYDSADTGYTWSLNYTVTEDNMLNYTFSTNAPNVDGSTGTVTVSDGGYGGGYGIYVDFGALSGGTVSGSMSPRAMDGSNFTLDPYGMNGIYSSTYYELRQ